ncbi:cytochrome b/b6 domain-containing protein [Oricola nitratireducens]|uniref:cytochrome b/b6 domain-containing protein n=1 Tax=Oricola nitratireducens TaxID=2775868 RepID=UPI001868DD24
MQRPYTQLQIALHWFVVLLIFGQWYTSSAIPRTHNPLLPPSESDLIQHAIHTYAGVLIGGVMAIRLMLAHASYRRRPPMHLALTERLASIVHGGLYLAVLCQVTAGFVTTYLWGPARVIHAFFWDVILILASVHIAAAAYHLTRGDGVFRRMIPWLR